MVLNFREKVRVGYTGLEVNTFKTWEKRRCLRREFRREESVRSGGAVALL